MRSSGLKWESVDQGDKGNIIDEENNEVIEVPAGGICKNVRKGSRTRVKGPREKEEEERYSNNGLIGTTERDEPTDGNWVEEVAVEAAIKGRAYEQHGAAGRAGCNEGEERDLEDLVDLFGDADAGGFDDFSPERVTDGELFNK